MARENADNTLGVEFFVKPFELVAKSQEAGRPIYEDREMVRIVFPGDRLRELVAPAHEMHFVDYARRQMTYAERFAAAYQAFKDGLGEIGVGTPLSELPFLTEARRAELRAQKINTAEQLAGLPDSLLSKALGMQGRELRDKAVAYLKAAEGTTEVAELRRQLEELRAQLAGVPVSVGDQFDGFDRDDLFAMATDAGLQPRQNASRDSLVKLLSEAAKAKEAA